MSVEFQRLEKLWNFAEEKYQQSPTVTTVDFRALYLIANTALVHRLIRGVLTLVRGQSADGLEVMVRVAVEALINAKYIIEDETNMRAHAFIVVDHRDRVKMINQNLELFQNGRSPLITNDAERTQYQTLKTQLIQEIKDLESTHGVENLRWPPLDQRAAACGAVGLYWTGYWFLSQDSHITPRSLDRFMSAGQDGIVIEYGHNLSMLSNHLGALCDIYIGLLSKCSEIVGFPSKEDLKNLMLNN